MSKLIVSGLALSILIGGCAVTGNVTDKAGILSVPGGEVRKVWQTSKTEAEAVSQTGWLTDLDDTALQGLVLRAYEHNPDLDVLVANLDRARAEAIRVRAALIPMLDGLAGASRTEEFEGNARSQTGLDASLQVSWDPDIWGRLRTASRAGALQAEAAEADLAAGQQLLAASVAETYFLAIEATGLAEVSKRNLDALTETLGFVTVQFERGLRSGQDISLIRADVASAQVAYNAAQGAERRAARALQILIGAYPEASSFAELVLPDAPALPALGYPADILQNRPDLIAARYRIAASYEVHKSAIAAQYPDISLTGIIGGQAGEIGRVFDPASLAASLFANVAAPIFDGGLRRADVTIARADIDASVANFQNIALDAFLDVENRIDQNAILELQEAELDKALADAEDALRFTRFQYESGESGLLNVLQVQQRVSFIEAQLVSTRRARLVEYINLALALGQPPLTANI